MLQMVKPKCISTKVILLLKTKEPKTRTVQPLQHKKLHCSLLFCRVLSSEGVGVSREEEEGEDEGRMGARCGGVSASFTLYAFPRSILSDNQWWIFNAVYLYCFNVIKCEVKRSRGWVNLVQLIFHLVKRTKIGNYIIVLYKSEIFCISLWQLNI